MEKDMRERLIMRLKSQLERPGMYAHDALGIYVLIDTTLQDLCWLDGNEYDWGKGLDYVATNFPLATGIGHLEKTIGKKSPTEAASFMAEVASRLGYFDAHPVSEKVWNQALYLLMDKNLDWTMQEIDEIIPELSFGKHGKSVYGLSSSDNSGWMYLDFETWKSVHDPNPKLRNIRLSHHDRAHEIIFTPYGNTL